MADDTPHQVAQAFHHTVVSYLDHIGERTSIGYIERLLGLHASQYRRAISQGKCTIAAVLRWCEAWEQRGYPPITITLGAGAISVEITADAHHGLGAGPGAPP